MNKVIESERVRRFNEIKATISAGLKKTYPATQQFIVDDGLGTMSAHELIDFIVSRVSSKLWIGLCQVRPMDMWDAMFRYAVKMSFAELVGGEV